MAKLILIKLVNILNIIIKYFIPHGNYCYKILEEPDSKNKFHLKTKCCPFWEQKLDKPEQASGYCHYLQEGDWENNHFSLLWDQVKECGINDN